MSNNNSHNSHPSKRRSLRERGGAAFIVGGIGIAALQGHAVAAPNKAPTQAAINKAVQNRADKIGTKINAISSTSTPHSTQRTIRLIPRNHGETEMILRGDLGPAPHDKHKIRGNYILKVTGVLGKDGGFTDETHVGLEIDKPTNKHGYIYEFDMEREFDNPNSWLVNATYAYSAHTGGNRIIDRTVGKLHNPFDPDFFSPITLNKFEEISGETLPVLNAIAHGHLPKERPEPINTSPLLHI